MMELVTLEATYKDQKAVIINIEPNPSWGCIGENFRTQVKFPDGKVKTVCGQKGDVGDSILAPRKDGKSASFFGILGDRNIIWMVKNLH